jgi:hypothetical protein
VPGKTPYEAYQQFVKPIERAVACVARTKLLIAPRGHSLGTQYTMFFPNGDPVALRGEARLLLDLGLTYEIVEDTSIVGGPFRVTTRGYQHSLSSSNGLEIVGYHWHPSGKSHELRPHVHIGSSQLRDQAVLRNKAHVMTGRCSIEQVIRTAIQLGASPACADWSDRLDEGHEIFVKYRSWH